MQIKNPTSSDIKVSIKGIEYFIEANGSLDNIPEEVARFWQESLHKFLILKKDSLENKVEVKPIPDEMTAKVKEPKVVDKEEEEVKKEVKETPKKETILEKAKKVVAKKINKNK